MSVPQWAFWDAETLPRLPKAEKLAAFDRIWLVYTNKNPLPFCNADQKQALEVRLQTLSGVSNVALFMGFLLGQAHTEADSTVAFQVFSGEKSLKPIIQHLTQQGRACRRTVPKIYTPDLDQQLVKVLQTLDKRPLDLRPKTREAMLNFLVNILPPKADVVQVWDELLTRQFIELQTDNQSLVFINESMGWPVFLLLENLRSIPPRQRPTKYNRLVNHIGTFFSKKVNPHLIISQLENEKLLSSRHNQVTYHF